MGTRRFPLHAPLLAAGLALVGACSSETTNTSGGGGTGSGGTGGAGGGAGAASTCEATCKTIDGAGCPAESLPECTDVCVKSSPTCPTAFAKFATCVDANKGQISCSSAGKAVFPGCESEYVALAPCSACIARSSDTKEESCQRTHCCPELKDLYAEADVPLFFACVSQCVGSAPDACVDGCKNKFPMTGTKYEALRTCKEKNCLGTGG